MRAFIVPLLLAASAGLLAWLGQATDLDLYIARLSYDETRSQFPWRDAWFTKQLFHVYSRFILVMIATGFLLCAIADTFQPAKHWSRPTGLRVRMVALCALTIPAAISALKHASRLHCPWDLALFGGAEPYFRLFDVIPPTVTAGRCFPAGHASAGLWLTSVMVFWLPEAPRKALTAGAAMLCLGLTMGAIQQLRGAHFTTHTLWSAWIAVALVYLAYWVLRTVEQHEASRSAI